MFFAPQKLDRPPSVGVFFYLLELAVATVANSGKISPQNTYLGVAFVGVLALSIGIGHTRDCLSVVTRRFCPVLLNLIIRIATLFSLGAFSLPLSQSPKVPLVEHQVRSWWKRLGYSELPWLRGNVPEQRNILFLQVCIPFGQSVCDGDASLSSTLSEQ